MDLQTAKDYIEDLKIERALLLAEIDQLQELVRSLEAERDQWQTKAVSHD